MHSAWFVAQSTLATIFVQGCRIFLIESPSGSVVILERKTHMFGQGLSIPSRVHRGDSYMQLLLTLDLVAPVVFVCGLPLLLILLRPSLGAVGFSLWVTSLDICWSSYEL